MNDATHDSTRDAKHDAIADDEPVDEALTALLHGLAEEAGITVVWQDYRGVMHTVSNRTLRTLLAAKIE